MGAGLADDIPELDRRTSWVAVAMVGDIFRRCTKSTRGSITDAYTRLISTRLG